MTVLSWFVVVGFFAVLVVFHELGHFTAAKAVGMRVERFSLFFPPLIARKKWGETEYAIGALPFGGYVKITGMNPDENLPDEVRTRAYWAQSTWKRVVVIAAGPFASVLLALILLLAYFVFVGPPTPPVTNKVDGIDKGLPAHGVLRNGDRVIAIDGHAGGPTTISKLIRRHTCAVRPPRPGCRATTPAKVLIARDGRRMLLTLTPVYDPATKRMRLGFGYGNGPHKREPFGAALSDTFSSFGSIAKATVTLPVRLLNPAQRKQLTGVVGVSETTHQTFVHDPAALVGLMAVVSFSLALINLFPFLPLDGGHIFWAIVEKLRRRPIPFSVMERSGIVGAALVVMLFFIAFTNDISRLTNGGFQVR